MIRIEIDNVLDCKFRSSIPITAKKSIVSGILVKSTCQCVGPYEETMNRLIELRA